MPEIHLGRYAEAAVSWVSHHLAAPLDAASAGVTQLVEALQWALTKPPALAIIGGFTALALLVRRPGLAAFTLASFLLVQAMGLWEATMQTLALVLVATILAAAIGIPLGILCSINRTLNLAVRPALDFMQTLPAYVYLIPAVFFFGVGVVPAVIATAIFAIPPGVRLTELGIRQVDAEMIEAANAFGAHPWKIMREVQLPLALPSIMAGVNQIIMLSLSMVVISGLVGAAGLGGLVVSAVTQLDIAAGFESGLAVVVLAIFLDRVTVALGELRGRDRARR
jgi:glycine betaine/proline transport system permease protein